MNIAIAGCGGMGLRHLYGLIKLRERFDSFNLIGLCDQYEPAAEHLARVADEKLGHRPQVFTDFEEMLSARPDLDAVDIVTDTRMHHAFAERAFEAGLHVIVEKPMAITMRACRRMRDAAKRSGRTLAVAENYRRDPMCRLARALIDAGAIGEPRFVMDVQVGGGDTLMHNTAWRVRKSRGGGWLIDAGVHTADLLLYYMGDVDRIYAETALYEKTLFRRGMSTNLASFYSHRRDDEYADSESVEADAVDTGFAVLRFSSGAVCNLAMTNASRGRVIRVGTVHGSEGTMELPASRSGRGPIIHRSGGEGAIEGDELLALAPGFRFDPIAARFFGSDEPMGAYDMPFEEIDSTLLAIEYQDFAEAIETGRQPEVDADAGMRALGLLYGLLEAGEAGAPVEMGDVLAGEVAAYQRSIDEEYGI